MLSLPGGDEGNEKHRVAFDAWGRQESLPNARPEKWQHWQNVILCLLYHWFAALSRSLSWSLSTSQSLNTAKGWTLVRLECHLTTTTVRDHADEYLALNLPRFGDGRQVTGGHHHGPRNTTHANIISVYWYLTLRVCVCVYAYMTISLRVVSSIMYLVQSFQFS